VHGYSSPAHSIPWPVACSWKDGDPHCTSERIAGKGAVGWGGAGGKKKGTSATAGRPATLRQQGRLRPRRTKREKASFLFPLQSDPLARRPASEPNESEQRPTASKGEQESLPPKRPLLPRSLARCSLAASSWLLAVRLLLPFLLRPISLFLFSFAVGCCITSSLARLTA
jgi:hypothetical protein